MSRTDESKRRKDNCEECGIFKPIKAKDMCQNCWHKVKRKNQPAFYLGTRYTEIKQRCTNKNNEIFFRYKGKLDCTRKEFLTRFLTDSTFLALFDNWKKNGWQFSDAPSVDRINNSGNYSIDNMQFLRHSDNCMKDQLLYEVTVYTKDKTTILFTFSSMWEAARKLKVHQANIWKVIHGERHTAGGYHFKGTPNKTRLRPGTS